MKYILKNFLAELKKMNEIFSGFKHIIIKVA